MKKIYFKHHSLRGNLDRLFTKNKQLEEKYEITEEVDSERKEWDIKEGDVDLALIWGATKYGAKDFAYHCEKEGIPYLFVERSPLLKNEKQALYFDYFGTTYLSQWGRWDFWQNLLSKSLTIEEQEKLENYRDSLRGLAIGVEEQQATFISKEQAKEALNIPQDKKMVFVPLQVDSDATTVDRRSSPWIDHMDQFVQVILENLESLPEDYYLVFKKHPFGKDPLIGRDSERVRYVTDEVNANALVQAADLILTVNSGTAVEGLVFHKPIISLGNSFYTDKGLTVEVRNEKELAYAFSRIENFNPPKAEIDLFIYHLVFDTTFDLSSDQDVKRLIEIMERRIAINEEWQGNTESFMRLRNNIVFNNFSEIKNKYSDHFGRYDFVSEVAKGKRVLDVSAGCGYGTYLLSEQAKEVIGLEKEEKLLDYARQHWSRENVSYQKIDLDKETLPFEDNSFDMVTSFETLEHIGEGDQFASELFRILKPDGKLFISTPQAPMGNPTHIKEYCLGAFSGLVHDKGFDIEDWYVQQKGNFLFEHRGGTIPGKQNFLIARKELDPKKRKNVFENSNIRVLLEITSVCNLKCSMCGQPVMERPMKDITPEMWDKVLDEIEERGYSLWQLHGYGEPLMHRQFEDLMRDLNKRDVKVKRSFSTNTIPLTPKRAESILEAGFAEAHAEAGTVRLCVDSMDEDVFLKLRVGSNFEKAMKHTKNFIKRCQEMGKNLNLDIQRLVSDLNPDEPADPYYKEFPGVRVRTQPVGRHHDKSRDRTVLKFEDFGDRRDACPYPFDSQYFVLTNGKVTKCCIDVDGVQAIGNVKEQTLDEIIQSDKLAEFRDDFKNRRWGKDHLSLCRVCTGDECAGLVEPHIDDIGYVAIGSLQGDFRRVLVTATARDSQVRPILLGLQGKFEEASIDLLVKEGVTGYDAFIQAKHTYNGDRLSLTALSEETIREVQSSDYDLAIIPFINPNGEGYNSIVECLLHLEIPTIYGMSIDGKLIHIKGEKSEFVSQTPDSSSELVQIS